VDQTERRKFYRSVRPAFDRLCAAYAVNALLELGAADGPFSLDRLIERGVVVEEHRKLFGRLVEMCLEDDLLRRVPSGLELTDSLNLPDASSLWRQLMLDSAEYSAELVLLGRCGTHLTAVLRGEENPLQIIFPQKGSATAEHLYDSSPACRIYNLIAAAAVEQIVAHWPPDRPLRVLELGAGTGGLTATVLPLMPGDLASYVISDVSEVFLGRARARFENCRFARFAVLDLEHDPFEQGFTPGNFDLILAFDVLHVPSQLRATLDRVKKLMADDGQLLFIEKDAERGGDLIFGQIPGYWSVSDCDLRAGSELLTPSAWLQVLKAAGFDASVVLSDAAAVPADEQRSLPQQSVFLVRKANAPSDEILPAAGPERKRRGWLLLRDDEGPAARFSLQVRAALASAGDDIVDVSLDGKFSRRGLDEFTIGSGSLADANQLLATLQDDGIAIDEIVHLAGLVPVDLANASGLVALEDRRCLVAINLIQAIVKSAQAISPRLTLVTAGATAGPAGAREPAPAQAPLWGLGRVAMNEHPDLRCRLIDLHVPLHADDAPARLLAELEAEDAEDEVLLTLGRRYVHRLRPSSVADQAAKASALGHRPIDASVQGGGSTSRARESSTTSSWKRPHALPPDQTRSKSACMRRDLTFTT
jgi:SAM-dependent methyltransferase